MKFSVFLDKFFRVLVTIIMIVYAISLLVPLIWMLYSSLKSQIEYSLYTFQLPKQVMWSNYAGAFSKLKYIVTKEGVGDISYGLVEMYSYSFIWSLSVNLLSSLCYTMTSYVISRYKFRLNGFIYALGIFLMITPIIGNGPATLRIHKMVGDYDNFIMRILVSSIPGTFYGFNFILLYGAWKSISWHYAEAAFIDGANNTQVFFKIMLPLIIPTTTVIFILGFLSSWNDYMTFITWLPSYPCIAVGLYNFRYSAAMLGATDPEILAGYTVAMIPAIVLYLLSQKVIMTKLNVGGLKG